MRTLFTIIISLGRSVIYPVGRFFFSVCKLLFVGVAKGSLIEFPVTIRGSGLIRFSGKVFIRKYAYIRSDGELYFGRGTTVGEKTQLIVDRHAVVKAGNNLTIEGNCILRSGAKMELGENVFVASGSSIFSREKSFFGNMVIGSNSSIGNNCLFDLSGDLLIGENVAVGANCTIYTHNHDYRNGSFPVWKGNVIVKTVEISDGAWIGANATILPGVKIGRSAIVGAGSVVTKNVEPFQAVGGNPAKVLGMSN